MNYLLNNGLVDVTSPAYIAFVIIVTVISIAAFWMVLQKANEPGWASLVPFMNVYKLYKIAWGNGWLFLLLLIPIVNVFVFVMMNMKLATAFGKSTLFSLGLVFLNTIFMLILGFGDSTYIGPNGITTNEATATSK